MSEESIKVSGTAEKILPLQEYTSGFSKRVLVINTGGKYPQTIPVEFVKDKTALLDDLGEGQEVTAYVNLRGNEYQGKYYANIQGWKLEKGEPVRSGAPPAKREPIRPKPDPEEEQYEEDDDIPF